MGLCASKDSAVASSVRRVYPQQQLENSLMLTLNYVKIPNKFKRHPQQHTQGLVGLKNLGNTCYINSALQCLSNTQPLSEYFIQNLHLHELNIGNPLSSRGEITNTYAELIKQIWNTTEKKYLNPEPMIYTIQSWNPLFISNTQQDSHELIAFLLDMLHEDLNRVKDKPYIIEKTYEQQPKQKEADDSWKDYLKRNRSIIVDLFQGQLRNMLQCLECNTKSYKFETFMYLSLPLQEQESTLTDCINQFLQDELLDEDNSWFCPKCKKISKSQKGTKLQKLPNILVIHLKRFKFTQDYRCKLRQLITFPIYDLNLNSYSECEQGIFDLYGVINHCGTLTKGHYTAYCKNKDSQKWYMFNDSNLSEIKETQVVNNDAYLLFYYKNCVDGYDRQSEIMKSSLRASQLTINKPSMINENGDLSQIINKQRDSVIVKHPSKKKIKTTTRISITEFDTQTPQTLGRKKSAKKIKLTPIAEKKNIFFPVDVTKKQ